MYCALQFIMKFEEIAPQQIRLLTGRAGNNCMVNIYFEISIVERMTVVSVINYLPFVLRTELCAELKYVRNN